MKKFTHAELVALPERPPLMSRWESRTNPATGITTCERLPVRFYPNDSEVLGFVDAGGSWTVGKDEEGYFKSRDWYLAVDSPR